MNVIDTWLIASISNVPIHSQGFTHIVEAIVSAYLSKGVVLVALLWWVWFRPEGAEGPDGEAVRRHNRELVVIAIASGLIALAAGRLLAHNLPFRLRPMYEPALRAFYPEANVEEPVLRTWSAFPSDHSMLWCAIAMGIFLASRPVGIYALFHAVVLIGLPRIYLGLHYPTDVLAGSALGIGITCVMNARAIRTRIAAPILAFAQRYPGVFYGAAFLLSFELATQFDELRVLAHGLIHGMSHAL
ncbi:phosphatase PAP2 family protein [Paraburkholderia elongata]|uniref:Phosphatase PAP2 family protein n=1 Tax=Paraburkholderia elongata TaxID=2675747 RepID=A0A972NVY1_9BURK|nr:phosphatase PAP2 family protein [Paraburkholderia elongata]NPT59917.1 phosphatase PAP2 family protein [Paraburkholderia elongata]